MAYSQEDIDNLKTTISRGEIEVQYKDRKVKYRSIDEMIKVLSVMESEVNPSTSTTRPKNYRITTDRSNYP